MILHNYILYYGEPSYIGIFPLYMRLALIFLDFQTGSGSQTCAVLEIWEYQSHPSGILEKWQYKSDPPNIKYNYALLTFVGNGYHKRIASIVSQIAVVLSDGSVN